MRNSLLRTTILCALASAAGAQVSGPVMGYLPDGGTLRTMYGIPPAGSVGDPLATDKPLSRIEVSPDQSRALAVAPSTGALMLLTLRANSSVPFTSNRVNGAASGADRIVFSPSGTAAALWFSAGNRIQVVSGLSATPAVRNVDATFLDANPVALAVSDDGNWVAGSWSSGAYALGPEGRIVTLPLQGPVHALSFFHRRADVAAFAPTQVATITDIAGAVIPTVLWSKPDEPPSDASATAAVELVAGFAVSFDNNRLSIAGNLGHVFTFDLKAGTTMGGDCKCTPTGLWGMDGSLFRLTGLKDGSVRVYDAFTNEIWFVPLLVPVNLSATTIEGGQQ